MLLLNLLLRYALAIVFTFLAWTSYWNEPETIVSFTLPNIIWWLLAIIMWVVAFTRYSWNDVRNWMKRLRSQRLRLQVLHLVMVGIVLVGGFLIFRDLTGYPPDMDSDHFEDINEIWHITELGQRPVYMYRAYGREPGHFYLAALIHDLTGQPLDFTLLKLTTGLEGLTIIIASFWVGRALFYEEDRRFGILIGVVMAAFVATSWWTLLLSRNGLRAVSMVTIIAITFVYTARAIRYNRRIDYVVAGLATGASLLTYQSTRLVPFMVGIGWLIGMAYQVRSIKQLRSWVFNFIALGITAAIVALPILYFAQQAPDMYFARSFARLVGDGQNAFGENSGNILANFLQLLPNLTENISKVLLAMNWRGDVTWAYGVFDGSPVLDPITGGLFVLGLGIVLARIFTRRDPFDLFLPIALFVMLMPSALSLANLIEVPSGSRMAGALPMVFIIIALCVVTIWQYAATATTDRKARIVIAVIFAGLWVWSATINFNTYFVKVFKGQRENTQTYHHAGEIFREFVSRTDAPGNVFMLWSQFWWDGRLLRIEAGEWDWDTFIENDDILNKTIAEMQRFEGTRYAFKPDSPVLVFFDQANTDAPELLKELFPGGDFTIVETPYTDRRFVVYEAPAQGCTWYKDYSPDWIPAACS
ncbi:MAG: hypothetical protein U0528_12725 [Anaerolineae bacterium]|nr:hypothetical protein [Anaerolineae bacterium]